MPVIGIDLGTTYSCVGVWQYGKVEIIANDQGNRTTPSYVAFTDVERLIGEAAKNQAALNPENTVFDAKRLIGRKFDDPNVQDDMKHWPFMVLKKDVKPLIRVQYKEQKEDLYPEEISSMVLHKMKETAELYVGTEVKDAVITVPAYFNDAQRYATKQAGIIAGLNVMMIISEPTAAALAYGLEQNNDEEKKVLIFDLGGGTFDVSVLKISKKAIFEVLSTSGNTHLGGEDFDNRLVNYLKEEFKRRFKVDISDNMRALRRLRSAAEICKRMLSARSEASVNVDSLYSGIDFHAKVSRARFEDLCSDLFESTIVSVTNVIADAKLKKGDIDEVVLVGGSTRIPKIRNIIQNYFDGKQLNFSVNPDEAVAYGATVRAAMLSGDIKNTIIENVLLMDVTPLSLGVDTRGDKMCVIIPKNGRIPCEKTSTFGTSVDNQEVLTFNIYEGERLRASANQLLGTVTLKELPPAPCGDVAYLVVFNLDENGILKVTAKDLSTGASKNIIISNDTGRLSKEIIDKIIIDAARFNKEDEMHCKKMWARQSLESYVYNVKNALKTNGKVLSDSDKTMCSRETEDTLAWLNSNWNAYAEEYHFKLKELKKHCWLPLEQMHSDQRAKKQKIDLKNGK